jgi:hypothetical protein
VTNYQKANSADAHWEALRQRLEEVPNFSGGARKEAKAMRLQNSHTRADRGLDPYFTPPEATIALLNIENGRIPHCIWEPAAGDGAIAKLLLEAGHNVIATDIADYGWNACTPSVNYLTASLPDGVTGIITNPSYALAAEFALNAFNEVDYLALLLRTNFLEGCGRQSSLFTDFPPTRIWISSRRLPMMHRVGWDGPKSTSNTAHSWFIWEVGAPREPVNWFDWKVYSNGKTEEI